MSIDGRGPSLNRAAENTIAALKSRVGRLTERLAVVEGVAQANADDRDSYMEEAAVLTAERDTARSIAVELEQQLAAIEARVEDLQGLYAGRYCDDPSEPNATAVRVVQELDAAINHITSTVMRDLCDDARETP